MGKKESALIPFLFEGLRTKKYGSDLIYVDETTGLFRMVLPHKTKIKGHSGCIDLLKDWDLKRNHIGKFNYSESNRRMKAALRRSAYLKHLKDNQYPLTYQILSSDDIKNKKDVKKAGSPDYIVPSPVESGYHSFVESPVSVTSSVDSEGELFTELPSNDMLHLEVENSGIKSNSYNFNHNHNFYLPNETVENTGNLILNKENENNLEEAECIDFDPNDIFEDILTCLNSSRPVELLYDPASEINRSDLKIYRFKFENLLKEEILMVCEPKEVTSMEQVFEIGGFAVDADVFKRTQIYKITWSFCRDNHLFLLLKSQQNTFGIL